MTRRNNSLFISLLIHSLLIILIFYITKSYFKVEEKGQKIAITISKVEFAKEAEEIEVIRENLTKAKEKKEIKEKVKEVVKEEKILKKPVEKKIEKEIIKEILKEEKIEKFVEIKNKVTEENQTTPQIKKIDKNSEEAEKIAPTKVIEPSIIEEKYSEINKDKILELLRENLYYPMSARKRGITAEVKISFTLDIDAKVYDLHVVESKSNILSRAAIKTIEELSGKFPKPKKKITLTIPINYNLY